MRANRLCHIVTVISLTASPVALIPVIEFVASADSCPQIEVVFARGTAEAPGIGWPGQQFIDALRWRTFGQSLAVYAVNYPATPDFATTVGGVVDASTHIRDTVAACPDTQLVLGGYSRGAALMSYVTAPSIPPGYVLGPDVPGPLPPDIANHVRALVLFGKPSGTFLESIGAPPLLTDPDYAARTIDLCAAGDPICAPDGTDGAAHGAYLANGMTTQAADFAVQHLQAPPAAGQ